MRRKNRETGAGINATVGAPRYAFTLVEVLVATAILMLLLTVFLSATNHASRAWDRSEEKMEEFSTARVIFNRLRADVESLIYRADFPLFPADPSRAGASLAGFMTARRAVSGSVTDAPRLLSYVQYSWDGSRAEVMRSTRAYRLDDHPPFSVSSPVALPGNLRATLLARGILGFQMTFLNDDGTWSLNFHPDPAIASDPIRSLAVRVSLLIVSEEGMSYLQDMQRVSALTNAMLLDADQSTDAAKSPEGYWSERLLAGHAALDARTRRSLYAFERLLFLPNVR
jgi:type II secretory pathway pseudopilin PulG